MAENTTARETILELHDLTILFGGLRAVGDFTMSVPRGGLYGLIGPNGAGKTTVFNLITGVYLPTAGDIVYQGGSLVGVPTHRITQLGIARTFQNIRLFQNLTVLDNVRIALHTRAGYGLLEGITRLGRFSKAERQLTERAQELLSVLDLEDRQLEMARNLPYGAQRRLEIARALATEPQLLLLDEPAAGMNPTESEALMELIQFVRESFHLSILLIEHQMRVVMGICEWITVMDFGQVIARGTARDIQNDERVIEAYLGKRSGKELGAYAPSS
ncbi:MAG: ABC transporter ATP-binding protein [Anaerolineae bacterium]|jgi:branched-chain amino acid transport system ATP-binding protein